jgi:hypothetical protein
MDDVNKPKHYTQGSIECIDAIDAMLEESGSSRADFYRTQIIKYIWRMPYKGSPRKDAKKARYYVERLICEIDL